MKFLSFFKSSKKEENAGAAANAGAVNENGCASCAEVSRDASPKQPQGDAVGSDQQPLKRNVYNLIILDESGSMRCIYAPALTGVNETLQTIRAAQEEHLEQTHFVTLVAFDTGHYNEIYHNVAAAQTVDITEQQYRPSGGTPLYDAMGRAINEMDAVVKNEQDVVLVTIITDGYENASREYSGPAIKALVEQMKQRNWVFTYIGANQDVEKVAQSMSISNSMEFKADMAGTKQMFNKECRSRKAFFGKIAQSKLAHMDNFDYFEES